MAKGVKHEANDLDTLLRELVEILHRRRPGQITQKIAEIKRRVKRIEAEAYLQGISDAHEEQEEKKEG